VSSTKSTHSHQIGIDAQNQRTQHPPPPLSTTKGRINNCVDNFVVQSDADVARRLARRPTRYQCRRRRLFVVVVVVVVAFLSCLPSFLSSLLLLLLLPAARSGAATSRRRATEGREGEIKNERKFFDWQTNALARYRTLLSRAPSDNASANRRAPAIIGRNVAFFRINI
jgi:hypothetical protein